MIIWFAAAISEESRGGINRSMISLGEQLRMHGHSVKTIYAKNQAQQNFIRFAVALFLSFLKSKQKPDWIIARSTDGVLCAIWCRLLNVKSRIVLHNHGWEEKVFETEKGISKYKITNPTTWKAKLIRLPLLRLALKLSHYCVSGTIEEARWISLQYEKQKKKCITIPNGVASDSTSYWDGKSRPLSFLTVGGFTWKKNIEYCLEIFEKMREKNLDAELTIVGCGKLTTDRMNTLSKRFGSSLKIIPSVEAQQMCTVFQKCPYYISTSLYEGGRSLAVLEAQSNGCIVYATALPSTLEVIHDKKTGMILTGNDAQNDAEIINQSIKDEPLLNWISQRSWMLAKRNSWERQGMRLNCLLSRFQ